MKHRFVIGSLVIVAAFVSLVANSMNSSTLRAIPVAELSHADARAQSFIGQNIRAVGWVSSEPVRREAVTTSNGTTFVHHFTVVDEDKSKKIRVAYRDALPDTFRPGAPVQVEGLYASTGQMRAEHVLTKCPSKYEAQAVAKPETATKTEDGKTKVEKSARSDTY
jgi:cytochrome c-type biogenesis protein CcmE